jgi:hypothetical protein
MFEQSPFCFCYPTFPDGDLPEKGHDLLPKDTASSEAPGLFLEPKNPDYTVEYIHKITYLESQVRILK